jgi:hypothetical protein
MFITWWDVIDVSLKGIVRRMMGLLVEGNLYVSGYGRGQLDQNFSMSYPSVLRLLQECGAYVDGDCYLFQVVVCERGKK